VKWFESVYSPELTQKKQFTDYELISGKPAWNSGRNGRRFSNPLRPTAGNRRRGFRAR
jgi:hypothetical protein